MTLEQLKLADELLYPEDYRKFLETRDYLTYSDIVIRMMDFRLRDNSSLLEMISHTARANKSEMDLISDLIEYVLRR